MSIIPQERLDVLLNFKASHPIAPREDIQPTRLLYSSLPKLVSQALGNKRLQVLAPGQQNKELFSLKKLSWAEDDGLIHVEHPGQIEGSIIEARYQKDAYDQYKVRFVETPHHLASKERVLSL